MLRLDLDEDCNKLSGCLTTTVYCRSKGLGTKTGKVRASGTGSRTLKEILPMEILEMWLVTATTRSYRNAK